MPQECMAGNCNPYQRTHFAVGTSFPHSWGGDGATRAKTVGMCALMCKFLAVMNGLLCVLLVGT